MRPNTIEQVNAGKPASFSWQVLVQGHKPKPGDLLRFLKIQAVLDYSELEPGLKASDAIRKAAADLKLASSYQARVRLTGPVPMNDDEFATIKENAALNAALTIAVVLFILWMALRWWRIIFAVFVSPVVGLSVTAALGTAAGRRAQPDIGVFRRAVRRPRCRFRAFSSASAIVPSGTKSMVCMKRCCTPAGAPARR